MDARSVVVTGAAGVLGSAVAARLAEAGWSVAGLDMAPVTAPHALALGGVDLGDPTAAAAAFAKVGERFGRLDGLVNVAGGFTWETVVGGELATWDRMYQINLRTALIATQAALPLMTGGGRGGAIVNVSAAGSVKAANGMGAYAASKSGVSRLTEALAEELKDKAVRVNAVLPSIIDTPANRADMPDADTGRWVSPSALADVVAFLLSDQASAVTGALLPVTGRV